MATLAENIESMADLVVTLKKKTRLTEGTILRIIDTNLAMMQSQMPPLPEDTDLPFDDPTPPEGEDAVIAAVAEEE